MKPFNFQKFKKVKYDAENVVGFVIPLFMAEFQNTFYKSAQKIFSNFLNQYKKIKKWMIFTDYVIGDKNKNNDVITFAFIPHLLSLEKIQNFINNIQPKDVKKVKNINPEFIRFLRKFPIFFINVILNKNRKLDFDEKSLFLLLLDAGINMLEYWCKTTPENIEFYKLEIKDFKIIRAELNKKSFNIKLFRDIIIVSNITAYLMYEMVKIINDIEIIGWFSDRDKLLDFKRKHLYRPFIIELILNYFHILCSNHSLQKYPQLLFGKPNEEGELWYDACNRVCDYICGTIADLNLQNGSVSKDKFAILLEKLIVANKKIILFKFDILPNRISTSRITIGIRNNDT